MGCVFGFSDAQWLVQRAYDWWFIKSPAVQIAAKDPTSGSLRANLPFGGTVELIALSTPDSMEWWAPDGSVRPGRLIEMEGVGDASQAGLVSKDVAFRFTGFSAGPSDVKFDFRPSAAIWAGGELKIDGKEIDGAWPLRAAWPKSVRKATMRLGFGIPTWRTIGKQAGFTSTIFRSYGDPQWSFRFPTMPTEKGGGCHVSFIFGPENKHWNYRLVAVDQNDVEHLKSRAFATAVDQFTVWDYEFSETVENIKEFRIQVQAVHWVEFRDVALDGRGVIQHTLKPAQFGLVHDLEFADLIDFDSGKTGTFPENQTSASFGEGVGQNVAWMQKNGFNAEAGNKKLNTVGMSFVNLDNEDWNNFDPEVLRKRIQAEAYFPWELKPSNEAKLPATFGFRTEEGGLGMLQLVAFAENVPGATIRYKMLQKRQIETR